MATPGTIRSMRHHHARISRGDRRVPVWFTAAEAEKIDLFRGEMSQTSFIHDVVVMALERLQKDGRAGGRGNGRGEG